ncbi:caskin-1-like isoform X2 [Pygocentrus nattereri]|uniref:caskin-1-like isoform X2 n=1 Tax=Pygocentrus nattereri TaxID=42514 RepID=UPI001891BC2E|nr:caskin-1-like isoform X2 [Pygocentrus nattereri]
MRRPRPRGRRGDALPQWLTELAHARQVSNLVELQKSLRFIPGHTGAPGSPPRCGRPDQWQEASKQNDQGSPSKAPCPLPGHLVLSAGHGTPGPPGPPPPPLPFSRLSETRGGVGSATALAQSAHIERGPEVKTIHALSLI